MAECLDLVDAITPVLVEWIANDGVMPEPEPEEAPAEEAPAERFRFKAMDQKLQSKSINRFKQDEEAPAEEEPKLPQDIIKPVTELVEAAQAKIDETFNEITDKLSSFKKETFRMEKEIGLKKKKGVIKHKKRVDKKSKNQNINIEDKIKRAIHIKNKLQN